MRERKKNKRMKFTLIIKQKANLQLLRGNWINTPVAKSRERKKEKEKNIPVAVARKMITSHSWQEGWTEKVCIHQRGKRRRRRMRDEKEKAIMQLVTGEVKNWPQNEKIKQAEEILHSHTASTNEFLWLAVLHMLSIRCVCVHSTN